MKKIPKALTIAGSDSGGGAGIQADLKTFASLGVHGSSVITAITAQNTIEVSAVYNVPSEIIAKQIDAVMSDIGADAVKIGMLSNEEVIKTVVKSLMKHKAKNIVLDPVMTAASGARLLENSAISTLIKEIMPIAILVTPNIMEAEVIGGFQIKNTSDMKKAARLIRRLGSKSVLIKGSHLNGKKIVDIFYDGEKFRAFAHKRINKIGHGTGCTLSSAVAAHLAKGCSLNNAVSMSIDYVYSALENGYKIGAKNYVLDHFSAKYLKYRLLP